jgi:hypothetical protein
MKKLMLIGFAIIMALTSCDCSYTPTKEPPKIDGYDVVTIDSCEYLKEKFWDGYNGYGYFAHKGNCRFCRERRQKEMQELITALKEN